MYDTALFGPILLIERLNLKHLLERQVARRLNECPPHVPTRNADHRSHERILRRNAHNHRVLSVRVRFERDSPGSSSQGTCRLEQRPKSRSARRMKYFANIGWAPQKDHRELGESCPVGATVVVFTGTGIRRSSERRCSAIRTTFRISPTAVPSHGFRAGHPVPNTHQPKHRCEPEVSRHRFDGSVPAFQPAWRS